MLTGHPMGDLASAALAINLGYLALERFRYRDAISRILQTAATHAKGMPDHCHNDKAWKDYDDVNQRGGPGKDNPVLHFFFKRIFDWTVDRVIAFFAGAISFITIAMRALLELNTLPQSWDTNYSLQIVLIWVMIVSVLLVLAWIWIGRGCVEVVSEPSRKI